MAGVRRCPSGCPYCPCGSGISQASCVGGRIQDRRHRRPSSQTPTMGECAAGDLPGLDDRLRVGVVSIVPSTVLTRALALLGSMTPCVALEILNIPHREGHQLTRQIGVSARL